MDYFSFNCQFCHLPGCDCQCHRSAGSNDLRIKDFGSFPSPEPSTKGYPGQLYDSISEVAYELVRAHGIRHGATNPQNLRPKLSRQLEYRPGPSLSGPPTRRDSYLTNPAPTSQVWPSTSNGSGAQIDAFPIFTAHCSGIPLEAPQPLLFYRNGAQSWADHLTAVVDSSSESVGQPFGKRTATEDPQHVPESYQEGGRPAKRFRLS